MPVEWSMEPYVRELAEQFQAALDQIQHDFARRLEGWLNDLTDTPLPDDWHVDLDLFIQDSLATGVEMGEDLIEHLRSELTDIYAQQQAVIDSGTAIDPTIAREQRIATHVRLERDEQGEVTVKVYVANWWSLGLQPVLYSYVIGQATGDAITTNELVGNSPGETLGQVSYNHLATYLYQMVNLSGLSYDEALEQLRNAIRWVQQTDQRHGYEVRADRFDLDPPLPDYVKQAPPAQFARAQEAQKDRGSTTTDAPVDKPENSQGTPIQLIENTAIGEVDPDELSPLGKQAYDAYRQVLKSRGGSQTVTYAGFAAFLERMQIEGKEKWDQELDDLMHKLRDAKREFEDRGGWDAEIRRRQEEEPDADRVRRAIDAGPSDPSITPTQVLMPDGSVRTVSPAVEDGARDFYEQKGLVFHKSGEGFRSWQDAFKISDPELEAAIKNQYLGILREEGELGTNPLDDLQLVLDLAGLIPVVGAIPDAINTAISVARGDLADAGLSFLAILPLLGDSANVAKIARRADKALDALEAAEASLHQMRGALKQLADPQALARARDKVEIYVRQAVREGSLSVEDVNQLLNKHISLDVPAHVTDFPAPASTSRIGSKTGNSVTTSHIQGAIGEEVLAKIIHSLPGEQVLHWGEKIGANGPDIISFNSITGQITFWDSKTTIGHLKDGVRVGKVIPDSKTFTNSGSLNKLFQKTGEVIKTANLPEETKALVRQAIEKQAYQFRTIGQGNVVTPFTPR